MQRTVSLGLNERFAEVYIVVLQYSPWSVLSFPSHSSSKHPSSHFPKTIQEIQHLQTSASCLAKEIRCRKPTPPAFREARYIVPIPQSLLKRRLIDSRRLAAKICLPVVSPPGLSPRPRPMRTTMLNRAARAMLLPTRSKVTQSPTVSP
jgi:hypothetical protein